jgi:hypothetical protein
MPKGFWEARETAKQEGVGVFRSIDWGAKFGAIGKRIGDYIWKQGQWQYQPEQPSYAGEVIFKQQFRGDTSYYTVEELGEEPTPTINFREGYSWVTWYSGAAVGEDTDRSDVKREIRIVYWIKSDEQVDVGTVKGWLDQACQNALRGGTALSEILNWHNAGQHYEVYDASTGRVTENLSGYEQGLIHWEYWNRKTGQMLRHGEFRK